MHDQLFNSFSTAIPPFRYDIQRIPIEQNGQSLIYFYDQLGYTTQEFALPSDAESMLSLIDGNRSVNDILAFSAEEIDAEQILKYIQFLDKNRLLESDYFASFAESMENLYEQSSYHNNSTAGISYPIDKTELTEFLDNAFANNEQSKSVSKAKGLYAPHIDPRVGLSSYVKAFSSIQELTPKRVVILATSHYAGIYGSFYNDAPFIISDKTFIMPNGEVSSDKATIDVILNSFQDLSSAGISTLSRAHRIEHSIELHLLFLNHIWKHSFEIIPILVGGMDELFYSKNSGKELQLGAFTSTLRTLFSEDEDTFFLISGDLSHFGRKFGDQQEASKMFDEVNQNDARFLEIAADGNANSLVSHIKKDFDKYRICGFPPLLTFLKTFPSAKGKTLSYDHWNERERESAVSFGSILFQ